MIAIYRVVDEDIRLQERNRCV